MHVGVRGDGGAVCHAHTCVHSPLDVLQDLQVCVIVPGGGRRGGDDGAREFWGLVSKQQKLCHAYALQKDAGGGVNT